MLELLFYVGGSLGVKVGRFATAVGEAFHGLGNVCFEGVHRGLLVAKFARMKLLKARSEASCKSFNAFLGRRQNSVNPGPFGHHSDFASHIDSIG